HTACFFLSSRRRHTRFSRDWSSDVCSSDLGRIRQLVKVLRNTVIRCLDTLPFVQQETRRKAWLQIQVMLGYFSFAVVLLGYRFRSEERRVGKECRSRRLPYHCQ